MSLPKVSLFAIVFTIAVLMMLGRATAYRAELDGMKPEPWLRVAAHAALPRHDNKPGGGLNAFRGNGELPPDLTVPIQFKNPNDLGVGKVLVASRGIGDPLFARTVVLLVQYDEKGALGLVLNRRTDVPLSRVLDLKAAKDRSDPIYLGGPVEPSAVFALVQSSAKIEKAGKIIDGVYLISDRDLFEQTLLGRPDPGVFHVYLGYAGWTQDQLRTEMRLGAWFILPADATAIFKSDPDSLWLQMIQKTELPWAKNDPSRRSPPSLPAVPLSDSSDWRPMPVDSTPAEPPGSRQWRRQRD